MTRKHARWSVVCDEAPAPLVIRDVGPWDEHPTVTNDAEAVVECLRVLKLLPPGRRLRYYDSEGRLGEIVVSKGKFAGFAPA